MAKQKRKPSAREKADKKRRKLEFMTIFINGKQKRDEEPRGKPRGIKSEFGLIIRRKRWGIRPEEIKRGSDLVTPTRGMVSHWDRIKSNWLNLRSTRFICQSPNMHSD